MTGQWIGNSQRKRWWPLTSNTTHVHEVRRNPQKNNLVSSRNLNQTSSECGAAPCVGLYRSLASELYCIGQQLVHWINRYLLTSVLDICPTHLIDLRLIAGDDDSHAQIPGEPARNGRLNPLNTELNPICYLLALLGAHHFLHVSRIRVKEI